MDYLNYLFNTPQGFSVLLVLIVWLLIWKGFALWRAARNGQKAWYVAVLAINSLGILEIVYLFFFARKTSIRPTD